jgi:hypothetical protein
MIYLTNLLSGLDRDESDYDYGTPGNDATGLALSQYPIRFTMEKQFILTPGTFRGYNGRKLIVPSLCSRIWISEATSVTMDSTWWEGYRYGCKWWIREFTVDDGVNLTIENILDIVDKIVAIVHYNTDSQQFLYFS